jgi:hypothetical protein
MADFDWKKLVGTVAPSLAAALGGPLAGAATAALSEALLNRKDGSEGEIATALWSGGTETLVKLKQAEQQFITKMRELDIDVEKIHQLDRASARDRETKTGDLWTPRVLAGFVLLGFLLTVYLVLGGYVEGLKDPVFAGIVGTLIGYVSAKADQVVSYYFGSSSGSAAKTELLARK